MENFFLSKTHMISPHIFRPLHHPVHGQSLHRVCDETRSKSRIVNFNERIDKFIDGGGGGGLEEKAVVCGLSSGEHGLKGNEHHVCATHYGRSDQYQL